jgi:hypothetical protein
MKEKNNYQIKEDSLVIGMDYSKAEFWLLIFSIFFLLVPIFLILINVGALPIPSDSVFVIRLVLRLCIVALYGPVVGVEIHFFLHKKDTLRIASDGVHYQKAKKEVFIPKIKISKIEFSNKMAYRVPLKIKTCEINYTLANLLVVSYLAYPVSQEEEIKTTTKRILGL